jgi:hypothetical protein
MDIKSILQIMENRKIMLAELKRQNFSNGDLEAYARVDADLSSTENSIVELTKVVQLQEQG